MSEEQSQRPVLRYDSKGFQPKDDAIVREEPLTIVADGRSIAVVMRTPGRDEELVRGLLYAEGVVRCQSEWERIGTKTAENELTVDLDPKLLQSRWHGRNLVSSAACGVCGAESLAVLEEIAEPIRSTLRWSPKQVLRVPDLLRSGQQTFGQTGGLHAAALFSEECDMLACREDVGRHNAVDKVIGWALSELPMPLSNCALGVSGRLNYEIVHKAIVAGIPLVIAISAPSTLALDLAERWCVTLAGFVRRDSFNLYTHTARIVPV